MLNFPSTAQPLLLQVASALDSTLETDARRSIGKMITTIFLLLTHYLWSAPFWACEMAFGTVAHSLYTIALFPGYIRQSFYDAAHN